MSPTMSPTRLFLLRHGEVESRYHRIFGGRIDMELSPTGHQQAEALARYLRRVRFDAIYTSPMKRAQQTLRPILDHQPCGATSIQDLCEAHFGDWTGLTWQQVHDKFQISAFHWLEAMERAQVPNGETSASFRKRVEPCVRKILADHPGQTVGIVCHGGVVRMIISIILDLPLPRTALFEIEYASATELRCSRERNVIQLLNFTPWRDLP